jgi:DNA-directed RNA polymerase specialized sigma24 family protein
MPTARGTGTQLAPFYAEAKQGFTKLQHTAPDAKGLRPDGGILYEVRCSSIVLGQWFSGNIDVQDQKYFPLKFWKVFRKTPETQLHLVDDAGQPVQADVGKAVELAFRRAVRRFWGVDEVVLAGIAEDVAAAIAKKRSEIQAVNQYAIAAVDGRVQDWLQKHPRLEVGGRETAELERSMGAAVDSALSDVETKHLFEQMRAHLSDRDRQILVLIEQDRGNPRDVAKALGLTYAAAAKAIQRTKARVAEILSSAGVHRRGRI